MNQGGTAGNEFFPSLTVYFDCLGRVFYVSIHLQGSVDTANNI